MTVCVCVCVCMYVCVTDKSTFNGGIRTTDPQFECLPTELKVNSRLLLPVGALYTNTAKYVCMYALFLQVT